MKPTIRQFNQIAKLPPMQNPIERDIIIYKILFPEVSEETIEAMDATQFYNDLNIISASSPKLTEFTLAGQVCRMKSQKISMKAMVSILRAMQEDPAAYVHHILFNLYEHDLPLEAFLDAPLEYAMPWVEEIRAQWAPK